MHLPQRLLKHIHFIGIGGIGMSGIAEVVHNLGHKVTGSDISHNSNIDRLQKMGINVFIGHEVQNIKEVELIVVSSAIKENNPELLQAKVLGLPIIQRAQMLAELIKMKFSVAVAGTHGKTTTTSMMANLFEKAGLDPTVINGGIINDYGTNARLGTGKWAVVEADESDGSFIKIPATLGIITNIDAEHMDFYRDFDHLKDTFLDFIRNIPFYGLGILCIDHPVVKELVSQIHERRIVTYGFSSEAQIRAQNLRWSDKGCVFDVWIQGQPSFFFERDSKVSALPKVIRDIFIPVRGEHNIQNALTLVAVSEELGFSENILKSAMESFKGVKRRFTHVGTVKGVMIIDDYAHHPVEIQTVIKAAKQTHQGRLIVVAQPHRYSRLHFLFEDFIKSFEGCDMLILAPVYSAGESPIDQINSSTLANEIRLRSSLPVLEFHEAHELAPLLSKCVQEGDMVICMGAGSITTMAYQLIEQMLPLLTKTSSSSIQEAI